MKEKHLYKFGPYRLDADERVLLRDCQPVILQPKDLETLLVMVEKAGHIVEKEELLEKVWPGVFIEEGNLARHIFNLRQVLGDTPDGRKYIETIPKRGYRFVAAVQEEGKSAESLLALQQVSGQGQMAVGPGEKKVLWLWPLVLSVALTMAGILVWHYLRLHTSGAANIQSIAVLPFANASKDPEMDYLGEGLSDEITNSLSRLPNLQVMAQSTVSHYKSRLDDPQLIGHNLHVDAVLTGRVTEHDNELHVEAELVNVATGAQLWGQKYTRPSNDASLLQAAITGDVAGQLRPLLEGDKRERLAKVGTQNVEAYQSYLKGRHHFEMFTQEDLKAAVEFFQKAVALDGSYAVAYAGQADAYALQGYFGYAPGPESFNKSREAARRALELDNEIPESHVSLAIADMLFFRNFAEAQSSLQKALALNPNSAYVHEVSCWFNNVMSRAQEAVAECQKAVELEPLSLLNNWLLGNTYYLTRHYDQALQQGNRTLEIDGHYSRVYGLLGTVEEAMGNYPTAMGHWIKREQLRGDEKRAEKLRRVYEQAGYSGYLRHAAKDFEVTGDFYEAAAEYAKLGQMDAAFANLDRAVAAGQGFDELSLSPDVDNIRADPRYAALRRRMGLPP